jgi:hypothetical protein
VGISLAFQPLSRVIERCSASHDVNVVHTLRVMCPAESEVQVRALLLRAIAERRLVLRQPRTADIGEGEEVSISAEVESERRDALLDNNTVRAAERRNALPNPSRIRLIPEIGAAEAFSSGWFSTLRSSRGESNRL